MPGTEFLKNITLQQTMINRRLTKALQHQNITEVSGSQLCALGETLINMGRMLCLHEVKIARRITQQDVETPLQPTHPQKRFQHSAAPTDTSTLPSSFRKHYASVRFCCCFDFREPYRRAMLFGWKPEKGQNANNCVKSVISCCAEQPGCSYSTSFAKIIY